MSSLSIQPTQLEIQIKPGSGYVQSYTLTNNGDEQLILSTSIDSWVPNGSSGNITFLDSPPDLLISLSNSDLNLDQNFTLNPHQSRQLVLKINAPVDAINGDRYLTFFVNQELFPTNSSNSSQLIKLGSNLLISVSNTELPTTKYSLVNFSPTNQFIDCLFSPLQFTGEIQNLSDYFGKLDSEIIISKNNQTITKLNIFPDNVLAHHSRQLRCLKNDLPVPCQIDKPLWPGFYQATINNQQISFVVLPYSILLFVFIITLIKIVIDKTKATKL